MKMYVFICIFIQKMKDHLLLGQGPVYIRERKYVSVPVLVTVSSAAWATQPFKKRHWISSNSFPHSVTKSASAI